MWVKDYMCSKVRTITPDKTLAEAVEQMVANRTNSLIVVDDSKKPIGVVSSHLLILETVPEYLKDSPKAAAYDAEGIFEKYAEQAKDKKVVDFMFKDIHILTLDDTMIEAATHASEGAKRILPVVDEDGKLAGVITRTCIKNALHNAIYKDHIVDPQTGEHNCKCGRDHS
ncbi:CBS domain-containing protein [Patescibacteria group bacterium]|nr:CBS domain-containing protein [Patescibacteria group bacterium]